MENLITTTTRTTATTLVAFGDPFPGPKTRLNGTDVTGNDGNYFVIIIKSAKLRCIQ